MDMQTLVLIHNNHLGNFHDERVLDAKFLGLLSPILTLLF